MAQQYYLLDLQLTQFPTLSTEQTRTIIGSTAGERPSANTIPSLAYCHNVMPTEYGIKSVGYSQQLEAVAANADIVDARTVFDTAGRRRYLAFSSVGKVYIASSLSSSWVSVSSSFFEGAGFSADKVTEGRVDGVSYLYYSNVGAVVVDSNTNDLAPITLVGLDPADILGVVGSSGYLLAYTENAIAWSSTVDPTDFIPDKVTGAGGGNVANIAGAIRYATVNTLGLLIYSEANTVAATYTGNAQFPFKFREVPSSRGASALDLIAYEANSAEQFVYSNVGLRTVTSNSSEALLPEVTDFLAGGVIEDFDAKTLSYYRTPVQGAMRKKVKYISSRYLVISYGSQQFTHALVYDVALRKVGKLKVEHVDVIDYIADQTEVAKESIGLVTSEGELKVVDFSADADIADSVAILGKLQFTRTKGLQLLGVEVENVSPTDSFTVSSLVSYDGKTASAISDGVLVDSQEDYRKYAFRVTGKNHSLALVGKFNLTTLQVIFSVAGRR